MPSVFSPRDLANVNRNDKIIFDRYYCINSAQTKEITEHYILQPHHNFIRVKAFFFMLVPGGLQFLIIARALRGTR